MNNILQIPGAYQVAPDFFILDIGIIFAMLLIIDKLDTAIGILRKEGVKPYPYLLWIRGMCIGILIISILTIITLILWK